MKIPILSAKEIIKALKKDGFSFKASRNEQGELL
jgi:predicted RNA binding protein YcfA (HicA-like mRNA interferase family)